MITELIGQITGFASTALNKLFPDADADAKRKHEQFLKELEAEVQARGSQVEINKTEAEHKSVFVAGWRPFIGWAGGCAMAYQFLLYPILVWGWTYLQAINIIPVELSAPPVINTGALYSVITGMLGIGAMRSFDKTKNTQTDSIRR